MKNFYAIDIVDVDLAAQEAIYNAYENCLIKEVYKSNGSGSPIQYKVSLETTDQRNLVGRFRRKRPCAESHAGRRISGGSIRKLICLPLFS